MNQAIRKTLALATFGVAALAASGAAQAGGVNWHIGINLPGFYPAPPPVVYAPPPVVYAPPPPVVYSPPPVVYAPAPRVYYRPAPIVYEAPVYVSPGRGYWHDGRWRDHDRGGYGWRDRDGDGRPDRYYRR